MNKKGAGEMIYAIMVMVFVLALAVAMLPIIAELTGYVRLGLDCTNSSLSTGIKATCIAVDLYTPWFAAALLFAGAGYALKKGAENI